ncbi:MAG: hypothetical protein E7447_03325 [Ruminococcaceae bacterium]|nr:hypothetical protein [Oscillospiraceae bacterium]
MENRNVENMIVSPSFRPAYEACMSFAEDYAGQCIVLWGPSSSGKTLLLSALCHRFQEKYPEKKVLMTTFEAFAEEYVLRWYREGNYVITPPECDLLIVDNMQFAGGREATQEEMARLLRILLERGGAVAMALDRTPELLKPLMDRLQKDKIYQCRIVETQEADRKLRSALVKQLSGNRRLPFAVRLTLVGNRKVPICAFPGIFQKWEMLAQQGNGKLTSKEMLACLKEYG